MKKIRKLFQKNLFFRYFITLFGILFLISCLLILEKSIPNRRVKANIDLSEEYYLEYYKEVYGNLTTLKDRHTMVDLPADLFHLSIVYLEDYKHPVKGFIEMNKDSEITNKILRRGHFSDASMDSDYSRYWHAHLIVLKPLLTFFTMRQIYTLYFILLVITFVILLLQLLKHSKLLTVLFTLGAVVINLFFTSKCDNFFYIMMISMISSIILIRMYEKKSKNIDLLFLISGILTACFDMLSCGTLSLTLPLFLYVSFHILDGKKVPLKMFIRFVLLWFGGWALSYFVKWILVVIHYYGGFHKYILEPMKVRIGSGKMGRMEMFIDSIKKVPHYLFPYDMYVVNWIVIFFGMCSFGYLLKEKKNRMNYIFLLILSIIPFIRYFLLAEHSNYHNYFTYRAFLPVVMFLLFCMVNGFIKIKKVLLKK